MLRAAGRRVAPLAQRPSRTQQQQVLVHALADARGRSPSPNNFNSVDFEVLLPGNPEECPHGMQAAGPSSTLVMMGCLVNSAACKQ